MPFTVASFVPTAAAVVEPLPKTWYDPASAKSETEEKNALIALSLKILEKIEYKCIMIELDLAWVLDNSETTKQLCWAVPNNFGNLINKISL